MRNPVSSNLTRSKLIEETQSASGKKNRGGLRRFFSRSGNTPISPVRKRRYYRKGEVLAFYLCILPWLLGFLIFIAGPMFSSFGLSFFRWDYFRPPRWAGLDNYTRMLDDEDFWDAVKVTFTFAAFYVPLSQVIALAAAVLLSQKLKGISVFRTIYYLPAILSGVAYVVLWVWLFEPDHGLINLILSWFGMQGPRWLSDPKIALAALIIMSLWGLGSSMIIYVAGLKNIPVHLHEAAQIDGAGPINRFFRITLPLLTPTIFFNLVLVIIQTFQSYTTAAVATGGGPNNATLFYLVYLYRMAFKQQEAGYASAMAWVLFAVILIFTLLIIRSSSLWVYYDGQRKNEG
ncbi:MAG: sugar ABC transporter permease [Chloroflexi bacterium]|nr:sugar ABC transporter permease [Chloroflexota bacterium]